MPHNRERAQLPGFRNRHRGNIFAGGYARLRMWRPAGIIGEMIGKNERAGGVVLFSVRGYMRQSPKTQTPYTYTLAYGTLPRPYSQLALNFSTSAARGSKYVYALCETRDPSRRRWRFDGTTERERERATATSQSRKAVKLQIELVRKSRHLSFTNCTLTRMERDVERENRRTGHPTTARFP